MALRNEYSLEFPHSDAYGIVSFVDLSRIFIGKDKRKDKTKN
jgi:hypothetical protein